MVHRFHPLSAVLCLLVPCSLAGAENSAWVLEFGPYAGYYDFDRMTQFRDQALIGLCMGTRAGEHWRIETEFEEVYTRRDPTDHAARQLVLALHVRYEPLRTRFSPGLFVGLAYVALDDSEAPDSFGEGYDVGLGLRCAVTRTWILRADWLLRRQPVSLHRLDGSQEELTLSGRAFRLGAAYAF